MASFSGVGPLVLPERPHAEHSTDNDDVHAKEHSVERVGRKTHRPADSRVTADDRRHTGAARYGPSPRSRTEFTAGSATICTASAHRP